MTDPSTHWLFWLVTLPIIGLVCIIVIRCAAQKYDEQKAHAERQMRLAKTGTNHPQ